MTELISFEARNDGVLVNALTKMGTDKDKSSYTGVAAPQFLGETVLDSLYLNNWLCRRVVDVIASEATRAGWELTLGKDQTKAQKNKFQKLVAEGERMGLRRHMKEAIRLARHHGGSVLVMIVDDGATPISEPIDMKRLRKIKGLHPLDRWRIWPAPGWSGVGSPDRYQFTVSRDEDMIRAGLTEEMLMVPIHGSRILRFEGDAVPWRYKGVFQWWGVSVLQSLWEVFKRYETGQASAAEILNDFSLYVQKIKGLSAMVAAGRQDQITARLELNALSRSVMGGLALDSDEEASFLTRSMAGVTDVMEQLKAEVQGASRIPHTKLWGTSPSGLGADGRSEDASFAQEVSQWQEDHLDGPLRQFYEVLAACSESKGKMELPEDWEIDFTSTFMLNDNEQADLRQKVAAADTQYIQAGVLAPNEVAVARFGGPSFTMETTLLDREPDGSIKVDDQQMMPPTFGGDLAPSIGPDGQQLSPEQAAAQGVAPGEVAQDPKLLEQQKPRTDAEERDDGCCEACDEDLEEEVEDSDQPDDPSKHVHPDKVGQTMHRWKHGVLHSGTGVKGKVRGQVEPDKAHFKQAVAIALSIAGEDKPRKGRRGRKRGVRADGSRVTGRQVIAGVTVEVRSDGSASLVGPYGETLQHQAAIGFDSAGLWEVVNLTTGEWTAVVGVEDFETVRAAAGEGARFRRLDAVDLIAMGVRCDTYEC